MEIKEEAERREEEAERREEEPQVKVEEGAEGTAKLA